MEASFKDILLFFDTKAIFTNYSFQKNSHSHGYLPLVEFNELENPQKIENLDSLCRFLKVPYAILTMELKKLVDDFHNKKPLKFPINISDICEKWRCLSNSNSFCQKLRNFNRKTDSNETKSTDNEEPFNFSLTPDENANADLDLSVILIGEKVKQNIPQNNKSERGKERKTKWNEFFSKIDVENPYEIENLGKAKKKVKPTIKRPNNQKISIKNKDNVANVHLNIQEDFALLPLNPEKLKEDLSIKILNDIDQETVPDFIYVTENVMLENVADYFKNSEKTFKNSIKKGVFQIVCNCKGSCNDDCICARYNRQYLNKSPPYKLVTSKNNSNGKVVQKEIIQDHIQPFSHIFECSKFCSCNKDLCTYQLLNWEKLKMVNERELIVKRYRKYFKGSKNQIVMWGLMTEKPIRNNTLVIEYLGEMITKEEADLRGRYYDKIGKNYLFDLTMSVEYKGENKCGPIFCIDNYMKNRKREEKDSLIRDFPLCIDGYYYGNLSRFINHSCNPNLQVLSIHVENREILLPRLVLFSTREIMAGEELTFDYNCYPLSTEKELKCACGEETCRGVIYN